MRRKPIIAVFTALLLIVCFAFAGCDTKPPVEPDDPTVTQNTQTFIGMVNKIQTPVAIESGANINVALLIYDALNDAEKSNPEVAQCKEKLDGYKATYDVLKAEADAKAEQERDERAKQRFITAVNNLPEKLTVRNRSDIIAAQELFYALKEELKTHAAVVDAYQRLDAADAEVTELERLAHEAEVREAAESFIAGVEELEALEEITLEAEDAVEELQSRYENFDDEIKEYEGVEAAKAKLDAVAAEVKVLRDAADIEELIELAEALVPVEEITLESERKIMTAESKYEYMSDEAKAGGGVAEALEKIAAARARYDELFAAAEKIRVEQFIAAANEVGTDIENVNIKWFDVLDKASAAYYALTDESQALPEVEEAFARWDAAQREFDKKGYKQIPISDPLLLFSGHTENPFLVLQNENNIINPLLDFFKADGLYEIDDTVTVWLNVYVNGEYAARGALKPSDLSHEIHPDKIKAALSAAAADSDKIVSGGSFQFTLSVEDNAGTYIPSRETKLSAAKAYRW